MNAWLTLLAIMTAFVLVASLVARHMALRLGARRPRHIPAFLSALMLAMAFAFFAQSNLSWWWVLSAAFLVGAVTASVAFGLSLPKGAATLLPVILLVFAMAGLARLRL